LEISEEILGFQNISFSQEGEDLILKRIFEYQTVGFYVDIGACHPIRFSNTYLFYKLGWTGINIDATPGSMNAFNSLRPNDINLELAVSNKKDSITFYMFNEIAINTFSLELAKTKLKLEQYKIIQEKKIETISLQDIFMKYLPNDRKIDFLNIDVEGYDYNVLKSNNWSKIRPSYVLVEDLNFNCQSLGKSEIFEFMVSIGYTFFAKTLNTIFFKNKSI
jgi:FkbM family methyltransferase